MKISAPFWIHWVDKPAPFKVCCGPRCGAEPRHRAIYNAVEQAVASAGGTVVPVMCQGQCTGGVTVIFPNGIVKKVPDRETAKTVTLHP